VKKSLSTENLKKIDKSDMLGFLLDFPLQVRAAQDYAQKIKLSLPKAGFKNIIFAGLGGSAIGSDLVKSYLYFENKVPMSVCREYDLPADAGNDSLIFVSSYSGNTEETISTYKQAKERGAAIVAISSGGLVRDYALVDKVPFIEIPKNIPPRCALGYMSIIPLCVLGKLGLAKDMGPELVEAIKNLEELRNECLSPNIGQKDNIAKAAALQLFNKFAVIYSAAVHFDVCVTRMRGQLAENSKSLASSHLFPEMNHDEIVGWEHPAKLFKDFLVVMLRDSRMHPRVKKRMDITKEMIRKEGVELVEIWSRGEGLLSRILSLIYIGDFISYYLAILYGVDPTPVDRITYLKDRLAKD